MDPGGSILGSWELWVLALLIFGSAFFSAAETSLMSVNRLRLRTMVDQGVPRARRLSKLLDMPNKFIAAILVGNNVVNIVASSVATAFAIKLWGPVGAGISAVVITLLILTFGEVLPKSLAAQFAEALALRLAGPISLFTRLLAPIVAFYDFISGAVIRLVGNKDMQTTRVTEEEIQTLISLGQEEGILDEEEHTLLRSVFEFGETTAEEVMVPRIDMVSISVTCTMDELGQAFAEHRFARLPVYDGTLDHIVGAVYMKDYVRNHEGQVADIVRPVLYVPETLGIGLIFARMKRRRISTAVVLDEYGQTVGMLTPSDITEEIMGNFFDEHDEGADELITLQEGTIEVDGGYLIEDLNAECDFRIPEETAHTIGGYVFHKLGRVPRINDRLTLSDKVEAVVIDMRGNRVAKVRLIPIVPAP